MKQLIALLAAGLLVGGTHATERGGSVYPQGAETLTVGAMPPPGLYGMVFATHYSADQVNGPDGKSLGIPGFKLSANAISPRIIWVTPQQVFGGQLSLHAIVPIVDVKLGGTSKSGVGDIAVGPALGFHHSPNFHTIAALDLYLPTGSYDKNSPVNVGRNHTAIEPIYIASWIDPTGLNADIKTGVIFNQRNSDTDYKSGTEFHFDYAVGWGFGNGLTAGVGGYYLKQISDDRVNGTTIANSRARSFAIGPVLKYDSGKGWFATLKWQKETSVRNGTEGSALWFKAVFPL